MTRPVARFLDRLGPEDRAALLAPLMPRRYGPDEILIAQDDPVGDVFVLTEGRVRVTLFSDEGKTVDYRDIAGPDLFGEIAALDGGPRSASVVALTEVTGGWLRAREFEALVRARPGLAWALLGHCAGVIRQLTARVFEFSTLQVRERLVAELLRLAAAAGRRDGAACIEPAPTHADLAARISTHREAVSREMSALAKDGILRREGRALLILDADRLAAWTG